jgi:hypothetical protein
MPCGLGRSGLQKFFGEFQGQRHDQLTSTNDNGLRKPTPALIRR